MHILESQNLTASHHSKGDSVTVQLIRRQITVETLQMRAVLVVAPGKRIPYHVRHFLDKLPGSVLGIVYGEIDGTLDHRVEFVVERLGDVVLESRQHRLVVDGALLRGEDAIARQGVLHGADEDREQREIRLGAVLQLILEDLHDRGDAPDREQGPVPVMKARHVA